MMVAENDLAKISITFSHKDTDLQKIYVEKMLQLKNTLHQFLPEQWQWNLLCSDSNGRVVSEIYTSIQNVKVLDSADWPLMISFFYEQSRKSLFKKSATR